MALLTTNNCYIKLNIDGNYSIYKTKADRSAELKKTNSEAIIKKYEQLLNEATPTEERGYYVPNAYDNYNKINEEFHRYLYNLSINNVTDTYPIMHEYYKTVEKTIPEIVATGKLPFKANTLEELYNKIKQYKVFGETEDI